MADKPKTYAQQVQELKDQLTEKDEQLADAKQKLSSIPVLQNEISELKARLEAGIQADNHNGALIKAQQTDLEQRAVSAEQGLRNLQALSKSQIDQITSLEQQLDIAGAERDKNLGMQRKVELLSEELKTSNLRIATAQQQLRDLRVESNEAIARQEKEVLYLRELTKAQAARLADVESVIKSMPDTISGLKEMIARW
jgi:chromosome segregation ATPase